MLAHGGCEPRPSASPWPLDEPGFRLAFEAAAWRRYGDLLTVQRRHGHSTRYLISDLQLFTRNERVPAEIIFYRWSTRASRYGFRLAAIDYPQVFADTHLTSPHRMPDGALCLFLPPAVDHWIAADGLTALIDLIRDHVELESAWRVDHFWRGPEEPHGLPRAS